VEYPYYYGNIKTTGQANRTMLDWLKDCEPGTWYSLDDLIHKVQLENPYFILPRRELVQMIGLKRLTELSKQWPQIEGTIIQKTFQTVLEWLGIVQIGRSETGRAVAFSLTDFGAEICGRAAPGSTELPRPSYPLLVQPNFEIMLFAPEVETLWTLEKFADLKKLDQVSLYTLTKDSVLRGLETGLTLAQIQEWLEKRNPQPLPQNLAVSLQDWSKGFKRVQIAEVTLLEVEDPAVLDELLNSKQFADSIERRLSPTAALVRLPEVAENRRNNPLKTYKTRLKNGGFFAD
jgi:DNA-binding transcriptional MerR regulator